MLCEVVAYFDLCWRFRMNRSCHMLRTVISIGISYMRGCWIISNWWMF